MLFFPFLFALFCKLFLVYTDFDENVQKKENECTSYSEVTTVLLEWPRQGPLETGSCSYVVPGVHIDIKIGPAIVWD